MSLRSVAQVRNHEVQLPDLIDKIEARIIELGGVSVPKGEDHPSMPVSHRFAGGIYCREISMPTGAFVVSKIHKTEHFYVISKGHVAVFTDDDGWMFIDAPFTGLTKQGTRRFLLVLSDTIWTTFHKTDSTDVLDIEESIMQSHENPLLVGASQ